MFRKTRIPAGVFVPQKQRAVLAFRSHLKDTMARLAHRASQRHQLILRSECTGNMFAVARAVLEYATGGKAGRARGHRLA